LTTRGHQHINFVISRQHISAITSEQGGLEKRFNAVLRDALLAHAGRLG
jgi:hypothetical protein